MVWIILPSCINSTKNIIAIVVCSNVVELQIVVELQFEGFNYKDLSESGIVFEVLVCDFYFCSPSLAKSLECTLVVDGSERLKLLAQLPEVLGRGNFDHFQLGAHVVLVPNQSKLK